MIWQPSNRQEREGQRDQEAAHHPEAFHASENQGRCGEGPSPEEGGKND